MPSNGSLGRSASSETSTSPSYVVRLYIEGNAARSSEAVRLVASICEEKLGMDYRLEVVDLRQRPSRADRDGIFAAPTMVKERPDPPRQTVGRLTRERVLAGLDLE